MCYVQHNVFDVLNDKLLRIMGVLGTSFCLIHEKNVLKYFICYIMQGKEKEESDNLKKNG